MQLNQQPLVAVFESGIDQHSIDRLLNLHDYGSSHGYRHHTASSELTDSRTSTSLFDHHDEFQQIRSQILSRVNEETGHRYALSQAELLQLTRYQAGQHYVPHYDYFNLPGYEHSVAIDRIATVLLYLTEGFQGGETDFPLLNLTITPQQGDLLYFHYPPLHAAQTLHAGLPVIAGEKRIANLWIRSADWPAQG